MLPNSRIPKYLASTSGSGSLPSNTVANPRSDLKAITTRSGVSYDGPQVPPPPSSLPKCGGTRTSRDKEIRCNRHRKLPNIWCPNSTSINEPVVAPKAKRPYQNSSRINKRTLHILYNTIESVNRVDVIDVACEEYAQEVLGFSNISKSGNPTPTLEPILSTSPPSLTPFEGGDFILEEIEACLTSKSIPPGIDDADFDPKEDLLTLERLLNSDPFPPPLRKNKNLRKLNTVESLVMNSLLEL
ncbi:hypothetical protein Tco_0321388 [Tanacetum coccineum]